MADPKALSVEMRAVGSIRPYPGNPRIITETAIAKVAASIETFGWRQPIVVDEQGEIIAGHTRYQAALRLKLKKVPVHVAAGLTPDQIKAYRLADNRVGEESKWDMPALEVELASLEDAGFDMKVVGFVDLDTTPAPPPGPPMDNGQGITFEERHAVVIVCKGEADQKATYDKLMAEGYDCKVLVN